MNWSTIYHCGNAAIAGGSAGALLGYGQPNIQWGLSFGVALLNVVLCLHSKE